MLHHVTNWQSGVANGIAPSKIKHKLRTNVALPCIALANGEFIAIDSVSYNVMGIDGGTIRLLSFRAISYCRHWPWCSSASQAGRECVALFTGSRAHFYDPVIAACSFVAFHNRIHFAHWS